MKQDEFLTCLEEILSPIPFKRKVKKKPRGDRYEITLKEKKEVSRTKLISKHKMLAAYKFDQNDVKRNLFPLFNKQVPNITRSCDYTIFYLKDNTIFILLCELKEHDPEGSVKQVEAGAILSEYIIKTANLHCKFEALRSLRP